ncbi:hypothetical protein BDV12DRAFT_207755 [Aspergillus spectabilis]
MATSTRNPNDSMKSTWRCWDRKHWHTGHWLLEWFGVHHVDLDRTIPVHPKTDMVPYAPEWQFHFWVIIHALVPLAIHQTYINCFHRNLSTMAAYVLYSLSLKVIGIHQLHILRRVGQRYGFFDGDKHERDGVPDVGVWKTLNSLLSAVIFRPTVATIFAYRADQGPSSIQWMWLPSKIAAYAVILDFWYYWYHRLMHENVGLWRFHRTHHLTKHPNPLLSGYADTVQEIFDILVIPLMTFASLKCLGFPISFYEWWVCQQYVIFTELLGHSGLRIEATAVNPMTWLLRMFDMELVIEDHDLHHRTGWRRSHNYGKQTRVWDCLFGTTVPRVEGCKGKIDYVNTAKIPLW